MKLPDQEPVLQVGIIERAQTISGLFKGDYILHGTSADGERFSGAFRAQCRSEGIIVTAGNRIVAGTGDRIVCEPVLQASCRIDEVVIGIQFHWQRKESQEFHGVIVLQRDDNGSLTLINEILLEEYLRSVISSEMSATAPKELLKAHAITSRSWLVAMLARKGLHQPKTSHEERRGDTISITRWYGREDHRLFDVCADDHCQRYHGITRIISDAATRAIEETRGTFLVAPDGESVCDARYAKSCGGITEFFKNAWENVEVDYLTSIADADEHHPPVSDEAAAREWILSSPESFCNTNDAAILRTVLPGFDQETADFYRWKVTYAASHLAKLLEEKSGIDFGEVTELEPLERGPSGRITKLRIRGSKQTVIVGKELEIRRWLAPTHLYSSAFVVEKTGADSFGHPLSFTLHGAGWGHGVGLCQIGAAVMAIKGRSYEQILRHYFANAQIRRLYR